MEGPLARAEEGACSLPFPLPASVLTRGRCVAQSYEDAFKADNEQYKAAKAKFDAQAASA